MSNEIKLFTRYRKTTKDENKVLNWIKLFLVRFFKDETQYFGGSLGEEPPTDLQLFSESGGLHKVLSSGFQAQRIEILTSKSNKDKTKRNALHRN
jgi:hypothetical protein